jgi:hypothetical protein
MIRHKPGEFDEFQIETDSHGRIKPRQFTFTPHSEGGVFLNTKRRDNDGKWVQVSAVIEQDDIIELITYLTAQVLGAEYSLKDNETNDWIA